MKISTKTTVRVSLICLLVSAFGFAAGCGRQGGPNPTRVSLSADELEVQVLDAISEPGVFKRFVGLSNALSNMTSENAPGAAAAYQARLAHLTGSEMRPMIDAWVAIDQPAALEWALSIKMLPRRREAVSQAIYSWIALDDGHGAQAYVKALPASDSNDYVIVRNNFIKGTAAVGNPQLASDVLEAMPDDETRDYLVAQGMLDLLRRSPVMLKEFVDAMPDDTGNNLKAAAFSGALGLLALSQPEEAARWYDENAVSAYSSEDSVAAIGNAWVKSDPEAAFAWIISTPPSTARAKAVRDGAYYWLKRDPRGARQTLGGMLIREEMAPAIFPFAQFMVSQDLPEAADWAIRVPNRFESMKVLKQVGRRWGDSDYSAASAWLAQQELPEEAKTAFLQDVKKSQQPN